LRVSVTNMSSSGLANGSARRSVASATVKMAVSAPIPSANMVTAAP